MSRQAKITGNHTPRVIPVPATSPVYYTGGGNAKMVGEVTQRTYWFKEGRPTEVFDEDIPGLLKYTKMRGCCGEPVRPVSVFKVSDMR